jgi:hypothetical protein
VNLAETDEIASELYLLPPSRFVPTRNQLVHRARAAGAVQLADELQRLRRPAASAWLVNLLARHERSNMEALLPLGRELRRAQLDLDESQLRRLAVRRAELIEDLLALARQHAEDAGFRPTRTAWGEVEETLRAALVDLAAGSTVLSGRLVRPLRHSGFGPKPDLDDPTPAPPAPAPPAPAPPPPTPPAPTPPPPTPPAPTPPAHLAPVPTPAAGVLPEGRHDRDEAVRRAQQRLAAAESLHWMREQELISEEAAEADARDRVELLDRQRIEARRDRVTAGRRVAAAREAQREAVLGVEAARRALQEAERQGSRPVG